MGDRIARSISLVVSACATILLLAIVAFIARESWPVWSTYGLKIITGTDWSPLANPPKLGLGTMVLSTLWVALGAMFIAAPLGFSGAVFLAEFAPAWLADD